jgi:hypothetical protein
MFFLFIFVSTKQLNKTKKKFNYEKFNYYTKREQHKQNHFY